LAGVLLIRTELSFRTFGWDRGAVLRVAEWIVIFSTFLHIAKAGRVAECRCVAVSEELIGADLESVVAYAAVFAAGSVASVDGQKPSERNERDR
jgi:hypothetical protein